MPPKNKQGPRTSKSVASSRGGNPPGGVTPQQQLHALEVEKGPSMTSYCRTHTSLHNAIENVPLRRSGRLAKGTGTLARMEAVSLQVTQSNPRKRKNAPVDKMPATTPENPMAPQLKPKRKRRKVSFLGFIIVPVICISRRQPTMVFHRSTKIQSCCRCPFQPRTSFPLGPSCPCWEGTTNMDFRVSHLLRPRNLNAMGRPC